MYNAGVVFLKELKKKAALSEITRGQNAFSLIVKGNITHKAWHRICLELQVYMGDDIRLRSGELHHHLAWSTFWETVLFYNEIHFLIHCVCHLTQMKN